jgi:hypothetical protein
MCRVHDVTFLFRHDHERTSLDLDTGDWAGDGLLQMSQEFSQALDFFFTPPDQAEIGTVEELGLNTAFRPHKLEMLEDAELKQDDKRKRSGVHIMKKNDINALAANASIQNPSDLLVFTHAVLNFAVKRMLPLATPLTLTKPHAQRAYGSSDSPENDYERLLFDLNVLLPVTALLRVGPYVVPLLVMRFVIDKTGRFLALVTCPWASSNAVFSVFHFFKNMLHMLHQMDKDDRLSLLRDFGESQVFFTTHKFFFAKLPLCF